MAYVKITNNGKTSYFEQTPQGLNAVSNPQTLRGLMSGQIQASEQPMLAPGAGRFFNPNLGGQQQQQEQPKPTQNSILDELYSQLEGFLDQLQKRGQVLNPNVEITPEKVAEFTKQAEAEIDPYYSTQLKSARESFLRGVGYSTDKLTRSEAELERKYGRAVRDIGEQSAERGFAQSGRRWEQEQDLATNTQSSIDDARRQLGFQTGTGAREFAQTYGTSETPMSSIGNAPRALAGQATFQKQGGSNPLYQLSPDVYNGLVGSQEFERRGAVRQRSSELEQGFRAGQNINQQRQLIF